MNVREQVLNELRTLSALINRSVEFSELKEKADDELKYQISCEVFPSVPSNPLLVSQGDLLYFAENIYLQGKIRSKIFGCRSVSDTSWFILIDLYISRAKGKRITISSACGASYSPPTTALRHISALKAQGMVERFQCHRDKRTADLVLTEFAVDHIEEFLTKAILQSRGVNGLVMTSSEFG